MPVLKMQRRVKAHADVVWKVISNLADFAEVAPNITKVDILDGEKKGLRRRLHHVSGRSWEEECVKWEDNKVYTMEVNTEGSPWAIHSMRAVTSMRETPKGVSIRLKYQYTPRYGMLGGFLDRFRLVPILKRFGSELMDNWVKMIYDREWIYRVNVSTIIKGKGGKVFTVSPNTSVNDTAKLLREKKIGSVLALTDKGEIAGVVSERDIVRGIADIGPDILDHPVSDVMTKKVVVCAPDDNMVVVMACMTDRRVRHLPVMDGDELLGIISIGDVVKTRILELETQSATLRNYIAGRRWRELYLQIGPSAYQQEQV